MNLNETIRRGLAACFLLGALSSAPLLADEVPCLLFTGHSESEHAVDLSKLNRITFSDDRMTLSNPRGEHEEVELLYSLFHHIEVKTMEPSESTGIEEIVSSSSRIIYYSDSKALSILSDSSDDFIVGIFTLQGTLIQSAKLPAGQCLSLENLTPGIYIAVATDGTTELTVKFVIN